MEKLFDKLTTILPDDVNMNIAICKTGKDKFTVSTSFSGKNVPDTLVPFMLKGTAEELDENFVKEIDAPLSVVTEMSSNIAEFKKAAEAAKKEATKTPAKPTAPASKPADKKSSDDAAKKKTEEEAKKKAEEEAKAKKQAEEEAAAKKQAQETFVTETVNKIKQFNRECKYNHAYILTEKVLPMVTDKKVLKELNELFATLKRMTNSFLVADNADEAKAFAESYFAEPAEPAAKQQEAETEVETEPDVESQPEPEE